MQRSHAPCGELKEKIRGSSSTSEGPCSGQAKRSEKVKIVPGSGSAPGTICPPEARVPFVPLAPLGAAPRPARHASAPAPTISISTSPSACATAVSIESASRERMSWRMISRSTTTAMSCL